MIKDLAASYVKQKESLILVTISMKGKRALSKLLDLVR